MKFLLRLFCSRNFLNCERFYSFIISLFVQFFFTAIENLELLLTKLIVSALGLSFELNSVSLLKQPSTLLLLAFKLINLN